jgi:hypothetical protein
MGRKPAPHTKTKWPFGHLKHMAKWPLKEKINKRRCGAQTCAPPSLKGRATWPFPTKEKKNKQGAVRLV